MTSLCGLGAGAAGLRPLWLGYCVFVLWGVNGCAELRFVECIGIETQSCRELEQRPSSV